MAKVLTKVKITECCGDYPLNVQVLKSVDGGHTYWYCGIGKFCRNQQEVSSYVRSLEV